jgi:hypothetical protein
MWHHVEKPSSCRPVRTVTARLGRGRPKGVSAARAARRAERAVALHSGGARWYQGRGRGLADRRQCREDRERGTAAAIEVVFLVPVLLLVCIAIVAVWRVWWAGAQLQSATAAGARAAVRAQTPDQGRQVAAGIIADDLSQAGLVCANGNDEVIDAETEDGAASSFGDLAGGVGGGGRVTVVTTCQVSLSDLGFPFLPATLTRHATASEVIDTYSGRQP